MKALTTMEQKILEMIKSNRFISQNELAQQLGISRSAVAGHISGLMRKGFVLGRAYVLAEEGRITCLGGAHIDRKARTLQKVQYGTSNPVQVQESFGGVARNIAENLGRLGASVALITGVGRDKEGEAVLQYCRQHGIDVSQSAIFSEGKTGTYTAILDPTGEMVLALADMAIYDLVTWEVIEKKWTHLAASSWIVVDTNLPKEVLTHLVARCHEEEIPLCIVPTSVPKLDRIPENLEGVELFIGNRDEIASLVGENAPSREQVPELCQRVLDKGAKQVILTMGAEGVFFIDAQGDKGWLSPAVQPIVDVTGAGDAFAAGVLFALNQGQELSVACRTGMSLAELTLQTEESVHSSLTRSLLKERLGEWGSYLKETEA